MATSTQEYPALAANAAIAAEHARDIAAQHLPSRAEDAYRLVQALMVCALTSTGDGDTVKLITEASSLTGVRFEVHYTPLHLLYSPIGGAWEVVSTVADAYGDRPTKNSDYGRLIYGDLRTCRDT
ncbi:hypothetical protein [Nonomuraea longicatena]|uniref:Uncharacterized protein n=1 Tax=Nonomuraea longicatena TaxID=83682 RepID=A0ABN1R0G0_9ACTN